MPQIRNTTTEEFGADDEVKKYANEYEDENAVNETNVDLVNDIKSDLIKKDAERIDSIEVGRMLGWRNAATQRDDFESRACFVRVYSSEFSLPWIVSAKVRLQREI